MQQLRVGELHYISVLRHFDFTVCTFLCFLHNLRDRELHFRGVLGFLEYTNLYS